MAEPLRIRLASSPTAARVLSGPGGAGIPPAAGGAGAPVESGAPTDPAVQRERQFLEDERRQLLQARQALEDGLLQLHRLREQAIQEAEGQLLHLAMDIARKVLMQEIQAGRYEVDAMVREALLHVPVRQNVVVHLNPDDWARCTMARQEDGSGRGGSIRFVADPSVQPAHCVLETPEGIIESSVEGHLADIAEALPGRE
jgi:flagellar assembly protein FliH